MKQFSYLIYTAVAFVFLTFSCSKNDDDDITAKNSLNGLSFSWDFENDAPYNRTYDIAFINDDTFEFSATAHGTTGELFGSLVGEYILTDDAVVFDYAPKGFLVTSSYVKPVSGKIVRDDNNKITGLEITMLYENRNGKVSTSQLSFYKSNYKPTYTVPDTEFKKLKEKDLRAKAWILSNLAGYHREIIFCEDHTTFGFGESWKFDEKTQTISITNKEETISYKISSGDKEEFECKSDGLTYIFKRVTEEQLGYIYSEIISGSYIDNNGKTLTIPGLSGTAAPALPTSTKKRIYETQQMVLITFEGLSGTYNMHYEGKEWDVRDYIPMGWTMHGGTIKISDPLKSHDNFKVTLTGKVKGEYTLQ